LLANLSIFRPPLRLPFWLICFRPPLHFVRNWRCSCSRNPTFDAVFFAASAFFEITLLRGVPRFQLSVKFLLALLRTRMSWPGSPVLVFPVLTFRLGPGGGIRDPRGFFTNTFHPRDFLLWGRVPPVPGTCFFSQCFSDSPPPQDSTGTHLCLFGIRVRPSFLEPFCVSLRTSVRRTHLPFPIEVP